MYVCAWTVARRIAVDYGAMRLSIGEALRTVLDTQPRTDLSRSILAHLLDGRTVPDELAVQALEVVLMDMKCKTRGYVSAVLADPWTVRECRGRLGFHGKIGESWGIFVFDIVDCLVQGLGRAYQDRYRTFTGLPVSSSGRMPFLPPPLTHMDASGD